MDESRKTEPGAVPWKGTDAVLATAILVVASIALIVIYVAAGGDVVSGVGFSIMGGSIYVLVLFTCWALGPLRYGVSLQALGFKFPASRRELLALPAGVLVVSIGFTGLYVALMSLLGWDYLVPDSLPDELDLEGAWAILAFGVVAVGLGPLAEEVYFRGFLYSGFKERLGVWRSALLSSLLFALMHVDPAVLVPFFFTGILLALLYERTGSVWSCFVAHAAQNALAFAITVWG